LDNPKASWLLQDEKKRKFPGSKAGAPGTENAKRPLKSGLWD
jgi:hypothetical protein